MVLEPYAYLRYLFEKLPLTQSEPDILELLPNRVDQLVIDTASIGGRLSRRLQPLD